MIASRARLSRAGATAMSRMGHSSAFGARARGKGPFAYWRPGLFNGRSSSHAVRDNSSNRET